MSIAQLGYEIDSRQALEAERNLDRMDDASGRAEGGAGKLDTRSKALAGTMRALRSQLILVASAAMAAFGARAIIGGLADYEQSMSRVQAITRATGEDMQRLRNVAQDLGATTEFSAAQAADGLRFLGMAGFNAAESMAAIPQVLDLATASGMGLADAADTASNIMSAFSIAASDAESVTDVLAAAASRANTDVSQLGSAMSFAGPVAASLGVSVGDAAAAVGVLSDAGIQGSAAGTGLRRVMSSLVNPTGNAADALRQMGLRLEDVNPQTNDLTDVVNRLAGAGLDASRALTIFGDRGGPAILALTSQNDRLRELTDELGNVDGAASQMAETMRDNLMGDLQGLGSAVQSVIIAMGDAGLTAALRAVVQGITSAARSITELIGILQDNRGYIIAAAIAITAYYTPAIIAAIPLVYGWVTANAALIASLITLRGAIIATGIGAFIVLAGMGINYLIRLREATASWGEAFELVYSVAKESFDRIRDATSLMVTRLQILFNDILYNWTETVGAMTVAWGRLVDTVAGTRIGQMIGMTGGAEIAAADAVSERLNDLTEDFVRLNERARELSDGLNDPFSSVKEIRDIVSDTADDIDTDAESIVDAVNSINNAIGGGGGVGGGAGSSEDDTGLLARFQALQEELRTQAEQVEVWYTEAQEALQWALENERLTLQEHADMKLQIERLYQEQLAAIKMQEQNKQLSEASDFFGAMASVAQAGGEKFNRIARIMGATQALINSFVAASQVLADPKLGFFGKMAAYATVLSTGLGLVSAIKGGGPGGSTPAGSAPSSASGVTQQQPIRRTIVDLRGEDWIKNLVEPMMKQIYEASEDGQVVFAR